MNLEYVREVIQDCRISAAEGTNIIYSFLSQVAGCLDNDGRTIQALDIGDDGHLLALGSTGNHVRLASIL